ncbi:MAG TPA: hypothetical protein VHO48_08190 [Anaerolineaceae bacterium]|nr:hypothetical protein [Anaerolineaceae bacterium]
MVKKSFQLLFLAVGMIVLFGLAACSRASASADCSSTFSQGDSFTNSCAMEVSEKISEASLHLTADLQAGSMDWQLADPKGNVVWESNAKAGQPVDVTQKFADPMDGKWVLTFNTHEAKGAYDVDWNGR